MHTASHISRKRPGPLAFAVVLSAFALLLALGWWQVQRLAEKEQLLATLSAKLAAPPVEFTAAGNWTDAEWSAVRVAGRFLPQGSIYVGPRTMDGVAGLHVFTPLQLETGGAVFVNRGWVPSRGAETALPPERDIVLAGVVRKPARTRFTPENDPATGQWYWPDLAAMANGADMLTGVYVQQTAGAEGALPVPVPVTVDIPNNHRGYALFWFSMAGLVAVFFWLVQRGREEKQ